MAAVFTSPILRAVQTAEAILEGRSVPMILDAALREMDVGEWDGRKFGELLGSEAWQRFNTFRSGTRAPGGEMMLEVQARAIGFLEHAVHEYRDRAIAVVSHADVIRGAICHYLGIPLDLASRIAIEPASVSTLRLSECGVEVMGVNRD